MAYTFLSVDELEILEQQAVDAAINSDWEQAIALNKKMVSRSKNNLKAYLRLGFAYIQARQFKSAEKAYKKALKIQPKNSLAQENLDKIAFLKAKGAKKIQKREIKLDPGMFLETPGKTKSVGLVKLGQKNVLAQLHVGQKVVLKPKRRKIEVRGESGEYIGSLPDDLSHSLYIFIKGGNEYSANIKEVSLNRAVVFIKEEKKVKKFQKYLSFPKSIQTGIVADEEAGEESVDEEDAMASELENLAENLTEEKVYIPYSEAVDDEDNEEE